MTLSGADLRITDKDDASFGYVFDQTQPAVLHTATSPNVPLNAAMSTPTQPGGQYDVRDTEGDKAITHLDWVQGEGQETLDAESSVYSRYLSSKYIDVSVKGQLKLLHPVALNHVAKTIGPMFSAVGILWLGSDVEGVVGGLTYSPDGGANWANATITGTAANAPIRSFCTDGTKVYFCHSTDSSSRGIWANTAATPGTFDKLGTTGTDAEIEAMAYNGGLLYAADTGGAGLVDATTGVYARATPAFLNEKVATVALVSAGNSVFWIVAQNDRSYVYKLYYDPATSAVLCEQFTEFPAGFIATCAVGYLGNVDVGGYFVSSTPGVGKGTVYRANENGVQLLFDIGDLPEDTATPGDPANDNRIVAACSGSKNEYFLTTRSCYRWDMDDGGISHAFDYPGIGTMADGQRRVPVVAIPTGGNTYTMGEYTYHDFYEAGTLVVPFGASFPGTTILGPGCSFDGVYTSGPVTLTGSMAVTVVTDDPNDPENDPDFVTISYPTAGAARTAASLGVLTRPSIAYEKGNLYSPYADAVGVRTLTITGNTQASPTIVTTAAHGIASGTTEVVHIGGSNSSPVINGFYLATYVSPTTFSIPVNVATTAGTAGTVVYNHEVGYAATAVGYSPTGRITQSRTTFHTGSMMKDFRYVSISHEPLPEGSYLLARWLIDGVPTGPKSCCVEVAGIGWFVTGIPSGAVETRFAIDVEGYSIETTTLIAHDTTGLITPVVKGVNVVWNFVKNKKHTYSLDCRSGANAGRWSENPETALKFLYATANERATFEDRFSGVYQGAIESVEFTPAPISLSEGPSGSAKIVVREEA